MRRTLYIRLRLYACITPTLRTTQRLILDLEIRISGFHQVSFVPFHEIISRWILILFSLTYWRIIDMYMRLSRLYAADSA
jgi:hypothetical protein